MKLQLFFREPAQSFFFEYSTHSRASELPANAASLNFFRATAHIGSVLGTLENFLCHFLTLFQKPCMSSIEGLKLARSIIFLAKLLLLSFWSSSKAAHGSE